MPLVLPVVPEDISIHALRMERDCELSADYFADGVISIHALRMERDLMQYGAGDPATQFQSTRSAWSATSERAAAERAAAISIHALRMERDAWLSRSSLSSHQFQSTRSAWSATPRRLLGDAVSIFQSTRSAWSAT